MLEPADEAFDFSGADIGAREGERDQAAKCRLGGRQPAAGGVAIALEQLQGSAEDSCGPHQTIGFLRSKLAFTLSTRQRTGRNLDQLGDSPGGQTGVSLKAREAGVPQPSAYLSVERERLIGTKAEKRNVEVAFGTAGTDPRLDFGKVRSTASGLDRNFGGSGHMASI